MTEQFEYKSQAGDIRESLSALMDGEASEMELHRVLKATDAESGDKLKSTWSRYQMVRDSMHDQVGAKPAVDLSAVIREAIETESFEEPIKKNWFGALGKVAIAASVAAVMVITTQTIQVAGIAGDAELVGATTETPASDGLIPSPAVSLPAGFQAPSVSARTVSSHSRMPAQASQPRYIPVITKAEKATASQPPSQEVQAYLQRVMEVHAGNAAVNSSRGMMPYAGVPAEKAEER